MALQVHPLRLKEVDDPLPSDGKISIMLADVVDPQNVGSILRTAFYFGIGRVYITKGCANLSPTVSKASAGSLESFADRVVVCRKGNLLLESANALGWNTVATGVVGKSSLDPGQETNRTLLVLGSEGDGIPKGMADRCRYSIKIDGCQEAMDSGLDSLNVGTAAGILISRLAGNSSMLGQLQV